ncbi:MAG: ATP-binding protein [Chloroflexota bacterium]|nr:ATP-binding protein [Chloroflexota bacterium]
MNREAVKNLEFFVGMPDDEIEWMLANGEIVTLATGDVFQRQDDPPIAFYITLLGEMQVTRVINGVPQVFGTNPPGIMGNEISILRRELSLVSVTAIMQTRLLVFDEDTFRLIFANAPTIAARVMQIATERMGNITRLVGQREKNAALGRLSAGLAHELNNPAAAARRSAQELRDLLPTVQHYTLSLNLFQLNPAQLDTLFQFQSRILEGTAVDLTTMERSDREDQLSLWLESIGVENAYARASNFVSNGLTAADMRSLHSTFERDTLTAIVLWLDSSLAAATLMQVINSSTQRISQLVDAVKAHTYMDQGEVQDVEIHDGLETSLIILRKLLGARQVVRQYADDLPKIVARGSELNEVWTHLIDNAINATAPDGTISLITRTEHHHVMVEIADNGHGIPEAMMQQIFEPFFTTKPLGEGLGLGLEIVNRIIGGHRGTIEFWSKPGQTRAIVRLPIRPPS